MFLAFHKKYTLDLIRLGTLYSRSLAFFHFKISLAYCIDASRTAAPLVSSHCRGPSLSGRRASYTHICVALPGVPFFALSGNYAYVKMRSWCHSHAHGLMLPHGSLSAFALCSLHAAACTSCRLFSDCTYAVLLTVVRTLHFMSTFQFTEGLGAGSRY